MRDNCTTAGGGTPRGEIAPLLPPHPRRILEVGCGSGATLRWLRRSFWPESWYAGVDINDDALKLAAESLDYAERCDLDERVPDIPDASIDLLLCLDVLEHLKDPWRVLEQLHGFVAKGGCLIASIPNVRHAAVVLPLLLGGRWEYRDSGILDRTHLRFYTRRAAIELVSGAGFSIDAVKGLGTEAGKRGHKFNIATLGLLSDFLTRQYLIRATKVEATSITRRTSPPPTCSRRNLR